MKLSERRYSQKILLGRQGNALISLIAIILVTFVLFAFIKAIWYFRFPKDEAPLLFERNVMNWFVLPASFETFLQRPWTLITHMFMHDNIWRVFANMLWLWSFGYIMRELTGDRKIIPVFIYGALAGAITFLVTYNSISSLQEFQPNAFYMGASSGVMAVAVATTLISPNYRIFPMIGGGLPLWALTALYLITDLATVSITDTGNLLAHVAGGLMGFIFIALLKAGYDWSEWMSNFFEWINNLFNPDKPKRGVSIKEELFYQSNVAPYTKTPHITQQRVDEILDKINQEGYGKLSEEEKDILRRASEEGL
jgi:membrane associated rhomboid family serine protease